MNYELLRYIPRLNNVSIIGNRTFEDFGLVALSTEEVMEIFLETYGFVL